MKWSLYLLVLISGFICLSGEIAIKPDSQPNGSATVKEELNSKESKDFIDKCLTLNNFSEVTLEYEIRMKEKYSDGYKTKIFMTATAATAKYDKKVFLMYYKGLSHISVDIFLDMFGLICRLDYKRQEDIIMIEKKTDYIETFSEGKCKIEWVGELPEKIFTIEEKILIQATQRNAIIVIDGLQFKDCDSAFNYIITQPLLRFKDGIFFHFGGKLAYDLSDTLFHKVRVWAQKHNIPFYTFCPSGVRRPGFFEKYIWLNK